MSKYLQQSWFYTLVSCQLNRLSSYITLIHNLFLINEHFTLFFSILIDLQTFRKGEKDFADMEFGITDTDTCGSHKSTRSSCMLSPSGDFQKNICSTYQSAAIFIITSHCGAKFYHSHG